MVANLLVQDLNGLNLRFLNLNCDLFGLPFLFVSKLDKRSVQSNEGGPGFETSFLKLKQIKIEAGTAG